MSDPSLDPTPPPHGIYCGCDDCTAEYHYFGGDE